MKLNLFAFHFLEQVGESNKLVDLFVKLKCQLVMLGSKYGKYPQLSHSLQGIFKGSLTDVAKMRPKKTNVWIFTELLFRPPKSCSFGMSESLSTKSESWSSSVLLWMLLRKVHHDRLPFLFFPSITCLNMALLCNIARLQLESSLCGERTTRNSQVAFNQIS